MPLRLDIAGTTFTADACVAGAGKLALKTLALKTMTAMMIITIPTRGTGFTRAP